MHTEHSTFNGLTCVMEQHQRQQQQKMANNKHKQITPLLSSHSIRKHSKRTYDMAELLKSIRTQKHHRRSESQWQSFKRTFAIRLTVFLNFPQEKKNENRKEYTNRSLRRVFFLCSFFLLSFFHFCLCGLIRHQYKMSTV